MEEPNRIYGLCPKCKNGYLLKETLFEGIILNRKKIITYYCPSCDFKNKVVFKLNEKQYNKETE